MLMVYKKYVPTLVKTARLCKIKKIWSKSHNKVYKYNNNNCCMIFVGRITKVKIIIKIIIILCVHMIK